MSRPRTDGTTHVTVGAGIRLGALNTLLADRGLAMRNLGDIDKQSIAGAISTGTHGTGARLGGLATQVVGARLVTATGDVVETSPTQQPELFELARLGLGSVGVLAAVTLEVVPAYRLEAREEPWPLEDVLEQLDGPDGLVEGNDHFEFYWFPHTRRALTKRNNRVPDDVVRPLPRLRGVGRRRAPVQRGVLAGQRRRHPGARRPRRRSTAFAARALSLAPLHGPVAPRSSSPRAGCGSARWSTRSRATELVHVLTEIDAWIESSGERVPFPVEVRFAAADDLWLSTAHGRETAYVAVHQYLRLPYARYFAAVERIVAAGGRPAALGQDALARGRAARARSTRGSPTPSASAPRPTPTGVFSNPYLDRLLGSGPPPRGVGLYRFATVEPRITRRPATYSVPDPMSTPSSAANTRWAAVRPSCCRLASMLVSSGRALVVSTSQLSNPMTARSSGTVRLQVAGGVEGAAGDLVGAAQDGVDVGVPGQQHGGGVAPPALGPLAVHDVADELEPGGVQRRRGRRRRGRGRRRRRARR